MSFNIIRSAAIAVLLAAMLLPSCRRVDVGTRTAPMGERVTVGPLIYNVFEAAWLQELPTGSGTRSPKNRFLVLKVSVTNGAGSEVTVPLLQVEDTKGKMYMEESNGEGLSKWMGLLRTIPPAQTDEGEILFDVPPGIYKLHVVDNGDVDKQQVIRVEIPFQLDSPIRMPGADPGGAPQNAPPR